MPLQINRALARAALLTTPALLTGLLVGPAVARAATTIVVQRGKQAPSTIYADGDRLRMDFSPDATAGMKGHGPGGGAPGFMVIDATARKMTMVNDRDKTFTEITEDDLKRMKAMRAQMAERLKSMTPEQRAQMQAMMGPGAAQLLGASEAKPHEWKFEPLAGKKTVNGFACETYRVLLDGVPQEEDCISPWSAGLVKRAEFSGLEKFGESMNENLGLGRGAGAMPLFHQYPGMPITRVVLEAGGARGEEHQVKTISHGAIPASLFAAPAGYTKRDLPQGPGPGGKGPGGAGKRPGPRPAPAAPGSP